VEVSRAVVVCPPANGDPRWELWVGDCQHPGTHIASLTTMAAANDACVRFAMAIGARALPWTDGEPTVLCSEELSRKARV